MNTTHFTARLTSFAFAAVLTLAMLAGVDTLAGGDKSAPQMAQTAGTSHS
jgi:negative regulator of sigma E activity